MFSPLANLLESCGLSRAVRRGWSVFSRRPRRLGLRSERPAVGLAVEGLSAAESLEMRRMMAVNISLVSNVLTVSFDDTSQDFVSLSINATGYEATGANATSGTGTISQLVVLDAGKNNISDLTLLQADQTLTGGLSISSNVTAARIEDSITTNGGDISIGANCLTTLSAITFDSGSGTQTFLGPVQLAGNVALNSSSNITFDSGIEGGHALSVTTSGVTSFHGDVGRFATLLSLTTDAAGSTVIGSSIMDATDAITFGDAVTLTQNLAIGPGLVMKIDTANDEFYFEGTGSGNAYRDSPLLYVLRFVHDFTGADGNQPITPNPQTLFTESSTPGLYLTGEMGILDDQALGPDRIFLNLESIADVTTLTGKGLGATASYADLNTTNAAAFENLIGQSLTLSVGSGYAPIPVQHASQSPLAITFTSTVDGGFHLVANGATTFSGGTGSGTPLRSLTVNAGTAGTVTFSDAATTVAGNVSVTARNIEIKADLVSTSGDISLVGDAGSTVAGAFHGVHVNGTGVEVKTLATDLVAGATGAITLQGRGGDAVAAGSGVSPAFGVYLQAGAAISAGGSGDVNVSGIGGVSSTASFSSGVLVSNSNEANGVSEIITAGGSIFVTGTAGGASGTNNNYGVGVNNFARIAAGGSGSVSVTGTATESGGTGNSGVIVNNSIAASQAAPTAAITSAGGGIAITGTGTAAGEAVVLRNAGKVTSGGSGNVTIVADSVLFDTASAAAAGSITAGAAGDATVTIRPRTAGTLIDIGGANVLSGSPLTLGLSTDEIDRITAGTLAVGSAAAGVATVSTTLTPTNVTNLAIRSAAGVTLANHITTDGGTITIDNGAGGNTAVTLANNVVLDTTNGGGSSAGAGVTVRGTVTSDTLNYPLQIRAGTDGDVLVTDTIGDVGPGEALASLYITGNDITLASIDGVLGNSSIEAVDGTNTGSITLTGQTYSTTGGLNLSAGPRDPSNVVSNPITLTGGLAESTTTISTAGGPVELSGAIDLNGRNLSIDTTAGGSVAAGGQVLINDAIDGVGSLTIDAGTAGIVDINQLSGAVGGSTPLTAVILTNAGEAYLRRDLTAGTLTITDTTDFVQLAGVVTLATGLVTTDKPYDLEFYGGVGSNSIAGATTFLNTGDLQLGIAANSTFTFVGGVVATAPAAISLSATIAATTGVITLGDAGTLVTVVGAATVGGVSTGNIALADVLLGQASTLTLGKGRANAIQVGSITGTTDSVGEEVTINTTGTATVTGAVGTDISAVTITNSGGTTFQSAVNATQVSLVDTTGTVTFQGVLTAETLLTNPAAYAVAILGGGSELVNEVEFTNTGGVTLGDGGDALTFPRGLTSTAGPTTLAGTLITDSPAADIGAPSRFGDLTLAADSVINAGSGNVTFNGRVDSGATGWAAQGGGVNTLSSSIAAFADSSSIVTGTFFDVATFGSTSLTGSGGQDVFIAKLNPNGTYAWATSAGGSGNDIGSGVATLADGSSIITGYFTDEATFGQTILTGTGRQMFVAKLDADGEFVWATKAEGTAAVEGQAISVFADGSPIVTGIFAGQATFGGIQLTSGGSTDVFVAKLDADGEFVWATRAGGAGDDYGRGVSVFTDGYGSSVLTGWFQGTATFGSHQLSSVGGFDIFVAKLNPHGDFDWATRAGGSGDGYGIAVATFADGSSVVTGAFSGTATFGSTVLSSADMDTFDIFIAKVNSSGDFAWATRAGGSNDDFAYAVATLSDGSAIVAGGITAGARPAAYQVKLDGSGHIVWSLQATGTGASIAYGTAALPGGASLVVGLFSSTLDVGISLQSDGFNNAFIYRAVESDVDGDYRSLTVTTTGDVAFNAPVGATGRLAGLSVGSGNVAVQDVTTSVVMNHPAAGAQLYSGNATLNGILTTNGGNFTVGGNTTLDDDTTVFAGTGNVSFGNTVVGPGALNVTAATITAINGLGQSFNRLANLTLTGDSTLSGGIYTSGDQTYDGNVTIEGGISVNTSFETPATVRFTGLVDGDGVGFGDSAEFTLYGGTLAFDAAVGSQQPLASIMVQSAANVALTANATTTGQQYYNVGNLSLNGSYTTNNANFTTAFSQATATTLTGNTTIATGTGNASLGNVAGDVVDTRSLTITSTGNSSLAGLGGSGRLASLSISGGEARVAGMATNGSQNYGGNLRATNPSFLGNPEFSTAASGLSVAGATILAANGTVSFDIQGGNLTFTGPVDNNNSPIPVSNLSINASADVVFGSAVGAIRPLLNLSVTTPGNLSLAGNVTTWPGSGPWGVQTYAAKVLLADNATLSGLSASFSQGLVGNSHDLTLDFENLVSIGGGFTGLNALTSRGPATLAGAINSSGDQEYAAAVTLVATTTLTAGAVTFGDTLDGAHALSIANASNVNFDETVGGRIPLADLTVNVPTGEINSDGLITTGGLDFRSENQFLREAIQTTGGVNGSLGTGNLTLNATRNVVAFGNLTATGNIATGTGNAVFAPGANVTMGIMSNGTVTIGGNATVAGFNSGLSVTATGNITLNGTLNECGSTNVFLDTDADILLRGEVHNLDLLVIFGATNVTAEAAISNAGAFAQLTGTGTTTLADVATIGEQLYQTGTVKLTGANYTTNGGNLTIDGAVVIGTGTASELLTIQTNGGNVTMPGIDAATPSINSAAGLTIDAGTGNVSLSQAIGAANRLSNLTITANTTSLGGPTIATAGPQNYTTNLTLVDDVAFNTVDANVTFNRRIDGAHQLDIAAGTGNVSFFGALGSTTPLQGLNLASAAAVTALSTLAIDGTGGTGPGLRIGADVNNVNLAQPGSTISNANLAGILLAGNSTGSTIGGLTITNSGGAGIVAQPGDYSATRLESNTISNSSGNGIMANGTANLTVAESSIRDNAGQGLMFYAASDSRAINNTIGGNDYYGIVVQTAAQNVTLTGNRIGVTASNQSIPNGRSGIFILDNVNGAVVQGNIVSGNAVHGIEVNGSQNITIGGNRDFGEENVITGNAQYGLAFTNVVTGSLVRGNDLIGNTQAGLYLNSARGVVIGHVDSDQALAISQSDFGVVAGGDLSGTQLVGNSIQNNRTAGLQLLAAQNLNLFRNLVSNNGPYGLLAIGDSTGSQVAGNTIQRHGAGIWLAHASGMKIGSTTGTTVPEVATVENKIIDNDSVGIIIQGGSSLNNTILSNSIYANAFYGIQMVDGAVPTLTPPTITAATTTQVTGSISGADGEVYRIQYFKSSSDVTAASQLPQGQTLIAYQDVTISGGNASINLDISSAGVVVSDWITTTATLLSSGSPVATSAFSLGVQVMQ